MCVKTEEKEGEKKRWKREKEGERLRGIELENTLGRIKGSGEVWKFEEWSLFVVVNFLLLLCVFIKIVVCDKCFDF